MTILTARKLAGNRRWFEWRQAIALPIFLVALSLYGLTLAPTVVSTFDDSLEFQLVTYQLAIAHPTGYPLYTLLGWIFTRLPVGDVAYRVNLMSAVFGALAVALVYLIGLELAPARGQSWTRMASAALGGLALAVSPVFWSQATVAEVYTLNAALVAGMLWLLVRGAHQGTDDAPAPFLALAFLFGLALAHHRTAILLLPAIVLYGWQASARPRPAWLKLAAAFTLPLLLYLYLPLRGHVGSLDGAYTNTLAGFWRHVSAGGYGVFIFENPFGAQRGVAFYSSLFLAQFGPLGLAAGLVGLAALLRRRAGVLTVAAFLSYLVFNLFYRVADIEVFFIPLFLIWAVWIGAAAGWLLGGLHTYPTPALPQVRAAGAGWLRLSLALAAVVLLGGQSLALLANNWPALDRSRDWAVYDYGQDLMSQPLETGAVIVGILGETTLVRYFQASQGLRPDLLTVAADREPERLAAVARRLEEGKAVYLTRELPGAPERWSLGAVGPLIRVHSQPVLEAPVSANVRAALTPEIVLHGYAVGRPLAHADPPPVRLALTWQARAPVGRQLKVSARLATPKGGSAPGQLVAQADAAPVHFAYPTTAWRPGEFIADVYDLALPTSLPPGDYTPLVILYDPAQGAAEVGRVTLRPIHLP